MKPQKSGQRKVSNASVRQSDPPRVRRRGNTFNGQDLTASGSTVAKCITPFSAPQPRSSISNSVQTLHVARNVVSETCRALGFNDIQIASVYSAFDKAMKDDQAHKLSTCESYSDPIPPAAAYHLERVLFSTNLILKYHRRVNDIINVQRHVRGFVARAKMRRLCPGGSKAFKRFAARNDYFRKLLKNEREYIRSLSTIINDYLRPLRSGQVKGVEKYDLADMFCNIESIQDEHRKLQVALLGLLKKPEWPFVLPAGSVIRKAIATLLPAYGIYTENVDQQIDTISHLKKTNSGFMSLLKSLGDGGGLVLAPMLHLPLNHVSSRMQTLLEAMLTESRPDDIGYHELESAVEIMRKASEHIIKCMEQAPQRANIKQAVRRIVSDVPLGLDASGTRRMLCEGPVSRFGKVRNGWVMLFTDLVLVGEHVVRDGANLIKNVQILHVRNIESIATSSIEDSKHAERGVSLFSDEPSSLPLVLRFHRREERDEWVEHLTTTLEAMRRMRIVGRPLESVLKRDESLPIMYRTMEWLQQKDRLDTTGIFRIPGRSTKIDELIAMFETEDPDDIDLNNYSVHEVGSVLRTFLRELPCPLIPFDMFDDIIATQREWAEILVHLDHSTTSVEPVELPEEYAIALSGHVSYIPTTCSQILLRLFEFLREVAGHSDKNQMVVKNLAMVFAPSVLRPMEETLSTAMLSPLITSFVAVLIRNFDKLDWCMASITSRSASLASFQVSALDLSTVIPKTSRSVSQPSSPRSSSGSQRSKSRSSLTALVSPRRNTKSIGIITTTQRCRSIVHGEVYISTTETEDLQRSPREKKKKKNKLLRTLSGKQKKGGLDNRAFRVLLEQEQVTKTFDMNKSATVADLFEVILEKRCRETYGTITDMGMLDIRRRYSGATFYPRTGGDRVDYRAKLVRLPG